MTAISTAHAHWEGSLLEGSGQARTESSALEDVPMTWKARTRGEAATTPEELLGAAHATCYSMALAGALAKADHDPDQLDVTANVTFGPTDDGFAVQTIELRVEGRVPGIDDATFLEFAEAAKEGCPISKAIDDSVSITLDARLLQAA